MRTWAKLVTLLAVLAFCMPAQGEILVYAKTLNCWWADFIEPAEDPNYWDCDTENIKGFLILDVVYDANDEIDYIEKELEKALLSYSQRQRRFGGLTSKVTE